MEDVELHVLTRTVTCDRRRDLGTSTDYGVLLQRYGRQDNRRCEVTVLTSTTRRVHCVGRYRAVGKLSVVSMEAKGGGPDWGIQYWRMWNSFIGKIALYPGVC